MHQRPRVRASHPAQDQVGLDSATTAAQAANSPTRLLQSGHKKDCEDQWHGHAQREHGNLNDLAHWWLRRRNIVKGEKEGAMWHARRLIWHLATMARRLPGQN
jgi:hypothetical protein